MSADQLGPPAVVEFRGVTKTFAPGTPRAYTAIKDVTFRVDDKPNYGEFVAIVGPSGCGKSTVLNLIEGFSEVYPPTEGEVLVRGERVAGPGRDRGMIFQKYSSFPNRTVLGNVRFGLELNCQELGLSGSGMDDLAMAWIQKVGLAGHEGKFPAQLSGGQQQRVAIARTLILKPRIILMDEPFSALDEPTRLEMQSLIMGIWHEVETTVFLVTHSLIEAAYLGDRVWIFSGAPGRIGAQVDREIPYTRDMSPLEAQSKPEFKAAVDLLAREFRRVSGGEPPPAKKV